MPAQITVSGKSFELEERTLPPMLFGKNWWVVIDWHPDDFEGVARQLESHPAMELIVKKVYAYGILIEYFLYT